MLVRIVSGLLFLVLIVYLIIGNLRVGERVAIIVGAVALVGMTLQKTRFTLLSSLLNDVVARLDASDEADVDEEELPRDLPAYKLELIIVPDWSRILEYVLTEANTDIDIDEFMERFGNEKSQYSDTLLWKRAL